MSKEEARTCERCGRPAVVAVGDRFFCDECYQLPGSCCPEFGGEDLWEVTEEPRDRAAEQDSGDPEERKAG